MFHEEFFCQNEFIFTFKDQIETVRFCRKFDIIKNIRIKTAENIDKKTIQICGNGNYLCYLYPEKPNLEINMLQCPLTSIELGYKVIDNTKESKIEILYDGVILPNRYIKTTDRVLQLGDTEDTGFIYQYGQLYTSHFLIDKCSLQLQQKLKTQKYKASFKIFKLLDKTITSLYGKYRLVDRNVIKEIFPFLTKEIISENHTTDGHWLTSDWLKRMYFDFVSH